MQEKLVYSKLKEKKVRERKLLQLRKEDTQIQLGIEQKIRDRQNVTVGKLISFFMLQIISFHPIHRI